MLRRILILLLLPLCYLNTALAETFIVTSNADSGPGTLREVLTKAAANGTIEKDYIHFNLPDVSEAGRTIVIRTQLPLLSSNLVIDATTQPGNKLGVSDTKIILRQRDTPLTYGDNNWGFMGTGINGIEIYGFYFSLFSDSYAYGTGILIRNSKDITIGKSGKGNVFGIVTNSITISFSEHISLAANMLGFNPITSELAADWRSSNLQISDCKDLIIGGDSPGEGNVFVTADQLYNSLIIRIDDCLFKHNTIGYFASGMSRGNIVSFNTISKLQVINNSIDNGSRVYMANIQEASIKGNRTTIDTRNYTQNAYMAATFVLEYVKKAIIGGSAPEDANNIHYPYLMKYENFGDGYAAIWTYRCNDILLKQNSISCKSKKDVYAVQSSMVELPVVSITLISSTYIQGKATPEAEVEVFSDGDCQLCEPNKYLGSVTAAADGSWQFPLTTTSSGYTASASINGRTSLFAKVGYDISQAVITHPDCGNNNGSITGVKVVNTTRIEWRDENNNVIGTSADINNLAPGNYTFTAYLSENCNIKSSVFTLKDAKPKLNDTYLVKTNASCGSNGSIKGLYFQNSADISLSSIKWFNQLNQVISTSLNVENVSAGTYKLKVLTTNNCLVEYGPIILQNTSGPNISETNKLIQNTPCNQSTGSITGLAITGTGTLKYSWKNEQNTVVATTKDLLNKPAGKYILQVTDDTNCGPVYSSQFEIIEVNAITISDAQKNITNSTCAGNTGGISGITVTGATSYQWFNEQHNVVANSLNLTGVAPGWYYMVASNATCARPTAMYQVALQSNLINTGTTKIITDATCGLNNGTLQVLLQNTVVAPQSYRWQNSAGQTVGGNSLTLSNVADGTYSLYGTDANGCETFMVDYSVGRIPVMQLNEATATVINDACTQNTGSIQGFQLTGGKAPFTYKWTNDAGLVVGTSLNLTNINAGLYQLTITDATGCPVSSQPFKVTNQTQAVSSPMVNALQLCTPGSAFLKVSNPLPGYNYRLYDSPNSTQSLDRQTNGMLRVTVKSSRSYYVTQAIGNCESQRTEVKVSVGISGLDIANTFTPNGDGVNDLWVLKGIENYPNAIVQIFNRQGEKVFESKGYAISFDGTSAGRALPVGAYYYIINLGAGCNLLSGSIAIIR